MVIWIPPLIAFSRGGNPSDRRPKWARPVPIDWRSPRRTPVAACCHGAHGAHGDGLKVKSGFPPKWMDIPTRNDPHSRRFRSESGQDAHLSHLYAQRKTKNSPTSYPQLRMSCKSWLKSTLLLSSIAILRLIPSPIPP